MAFGRLERPQGTQPMSEINMTPLIDVMLVLLVIFMLTAPLMTSSLKLDLPKADAPPPPANKQPPILTIVLTANGEMHLDDKSVKPEDLVKQAQDQAKKHPDTEVQLRADQSVSYGRVADLIGLLQKAGLNRIAFVTDPGAADATEPAKP
ncbi:ExbD/TolR family protein [Aquabacterium sp.]|uniref:ExbD/TolR family protein n=1 Tax=Aquabacterium sp. TaxID=1872578 RepID=UPI002E2FE398|nr:biopolymer transporter ExbD [Aquabacterium sp.]HEX5311867.1 biopolymer transporter ExbD [Aquabacterium sp.]